MTNLTPYTTGLSDGGQFCQLWSARVDALERHLSANTWALAGVIMFLIAYPLGRIAFPAALHGVVPDVVRLVLRLM